MTWPRFWFVAFAVWAFMFIVLVRLTFEIVMAVW